MALTKETIQDRITILDNGMLEVREATIIKESGKELTRTYSRKVIDVAEDTTQESDRVKNVASLIWTKEVRDARESSRGRDQETLS